MHFTLWKSHHAAISSYIMSSVTAVTNTDVTAVTSFVCYVKLAAFA